MPASLHSTGKRHIGLAVAVLMVVSLIASTGGAPPAQGIEGEPDYLPNYSACVGPATQSAGFDDVPQSIAPAVNCLAHYQITQGRSDNRYVPSDSVTRAQMVRFLARATGPAGILLPPERNQGFRDIDGLSAETRRVINQLAQIEIVRGRTSSTFAPDEPVTRSQMALFLSRFLREAPTGAGGTFIGNIRADDDIFIDIDHVSGLVFDAIANLYELGITTGTTRNTYSPASPVTRGQMAVFISRMLAHTPARPAGVTIQTENLAVSPGDRVRVVVSVRDASFAPLIDRAVDVFTASDRDDAIANDGRCVQAEVTQEGLGRTACRIDVEDEFGDETGDLEIIIPIPDRADSANNLAVWAWAGEDGAVFDADRVDFDTLYFTASEGADALRVTDNLPDGATALEYGATLTLTFQLVDESGNPVPRRDVEFDLVITAEDDLADAGTRRTVTRDLVTDSQGSATYNLRYTDPSRGNDRTRVTVDIRNLSSTLGVDDRTTVSLFSSSLQPIFWDEGGDRDFQLTVTSGQFFHRVGGRNTVTVRVTDQFGTPVRSERISVWSDDDAGMGGTREDPYDTGRTRRDGTVTFSYNHRSSEGSGMEVITATSGGENGTAVHYWVDELETGTYVIDRNPDNADRLDLNNDRLVVTQTDDMNAVSFYLLEFDRMDQFFDTDDGGITYDAFKEQLARSTSPVTMASVTVSLNEENPNRLCIGPRTSMDTCGPGS